MDDARTPEERIAIRSAASHAGLVVPVLVVAAALMLAHQSAAARRPDATALERGELAAAWVVKELGRDRFELSVQNTSMIGYIDGFEWRPASGDAVVSVVSASAGRCSIVDRRLRCSDLHLKPPTCQCRPGGSATVTFTLSRADASVGLEGSGLEVIKITPFGNTSTRNT
jgi:hypothetical protein